MREVANPSFIYGGEYIFNTKTGKKFFMKVTIIYLFFFILGIELLSLFGQVGNTNMFFGGNRIIVVLSEDWQTSIAELYCLERSEQRSWKVQQKWTVRIGRNGLGWGKSPSNEKFLAHCAQLHKKSILLEESTLFSNTKNDYLQEVLQNNAPNKREGDGKSPAGIFQIRKQIYGYAESYNITKKENKQQNKDSQKKWSYTQVTENWLGIDDPQSKYYNQLLDQRTIPQSDWNSYENLRREDDAYKWFLMIEHNTQPPIAYHGSCLFIHLWTSPNKATAGCVSMSEENFLRLLEWLQEEEDPYLIQLPRFIFQKFQGILNISIDEN